MTWLSEIEEENVRLRARNEILKRVKEMDKERMARVIRELVAFIKWKFPLVNIAEFVWGDPERVWSPDAKELMNG